MSTYDKKKENYIDNSKFSKAIIDYTRSIKDVENPPGPTEEIGEYFLKLCNGLSMSPNFRNYTFRDDMVMDAVENCIRVIGNYDPDTPTRTGKPNPFSYFTQIAYFAFLRRIAREKRQSDIKDSLINYADSSEFADFSENDNTGASVMNRIRSRGQGARTPQVYKERQKRRSNKNTTSQDLYDID